MAPASRTIYRGDFQGRYHAFGATGASMRNLALRALAALTRLEDTRLMMAQQDDSRGEIGCSLLRSVEEIIGSGARALDSEEEECASEALFVICHLGWSPSWRRRILTQHTEPSLFTLCVRLARLLWETYPHAIRECRFADLTEC
eukprot:5796263-Prymnesium_polylepis.1